MKTERQKIYPQTLKTKVHCVSRSILLLEVQKAKAHVHFETVMVHKSLTRKFLNQEKEFRENMSLVMHTHTTKQKKVYE